MEETKIATKLAQNVPTTPDPDQSTAQPTEPGDFGNARPATNYELDDFTQYKLHEFLGANYQTSDEKSKQRVQDIYRLVSGMTGDADYAVVTNKIRDLLMVVGISHDENKLYKLHQWLSLNDVRRKTEMRMNALRGTDG